MNEILYEYFFGDFVTKNRQVLTPSQYIRILEKKIKVKKYPIKLNIILYCEFYKPGNYKDNKIHIVFNNNIKTILTKNNYSSYFVNFIESFFSWLDDIQAKGSGLIFLKIFKSICRVYKINSLNGSSYVELPFKSSSIINIKNEDDLCFIWSVLAKLYPSKNNPNRVSNYVKYVDKLNLDDISFPIQSFEDVNIFEINNKVNINIFELEEKDSKKLNPIYISNLEYDNIDLLYYKNHFCLINSLDKFVYDEKTKHSKVVCRKCLTLHSKNTIDEHLKICNLNKISHTKYIKPVDKIIKFKNHHYKNKVPIVLYADFETCNNKLKNGISNVTIQTINSFGCYICSTDESIKSKYIYEIGINAHKTFILEIIKLYNALSYKDNFFVPIFFHNGSGYDFHFIIQELVEYETDIRKVTIIPKSMEEYISIDYGTRFKKIRFLDSKMFLDSSLYNISKTLTSFPHLDKQFNYDTNLLKQKGIYPYEYIDSIEKLKESKLPSFEKTIVKSKNKKLYGIPKTNKYYKYCYKWLNYKTVSLWYNNLSGEDITESDKRHIQKVWDYYNCKSILDYHKLYLKTDVLVLADAFENFRNVFLEFHQIDPCYCFSSPSLTWQCGLKYTGIELELIDDMDMADLFIRGIKGGFSGVLGSRYVRANNKYLEDYDPNKESNYLLHIDANNLYACGMSEELPTGDFKYEHDLKYYENVPTGRGCIIECDIIHSEKLKNKSRKFPLSPYKRQVNLDELSDYQKKLLRIDGRKFDSGEKLILDFKPHKTVFYYKTLLYYISMGMIVTKVYNIVSFKQSPWLKPYIDFNIEQRKNSKSEFEGNIWKIMINSFFGKTIENVKNRTNIKLLNDVDKIKNYINKPHFKDSKIFSDNFVAIMHDKKTTQLNKPIYLGMSILEYSKLFMYKFYYDVINKKFPNNQLIYTDTDSLILNIFCDDVYEDLSNIIDEFDTSNYDKDHFLYSKKNQKVKGKFKDESAGKIIKEVVAIRSKSYSILLENDKNKKKNCGSTYSINKVLRHIDFKNSIFNTEFKYDTMYYINSYNHKLYLIKNYKLSLSPVDCKRYIESDGITTHPFE